MVPYYYNISNVREVINMNEHRNFTHDDSLGGRLTACGRFFAHRINGHKAQRNALEIISKNPGISQKELAEALAVRPASISELLIKLENKGLITRIKDEKDHRISCAAITSDGENALNTPLPSLPDPFEALTTEEQEMLYTLLGKLLGDWRIKYPHHRGPHKKEAE